MSPASSNEEPGSPIQARDYAKEEDGTQTALNRKGVRVQENLPLCAYLDSLDHNPACILDISLALSYGSYSTGDGSAGTRPPIRVYSNKAFQRLVRGNWVADVLVEDSRANLRTFLLDLNYGNASDLRLEFRGAEEGDATTVVDFTVGSLQRADLDREAKRKYPSGLAVLVGTATKDSPKSAEDEDRSTGSSRPGTSTPSESGSSEASSTEIIISKADWTSFDIRPSLLPDSETGRLFLKYPWHESPLGPLDTWDPQLYSYALMCLSIPVAAHVGLGSHMLLVYNDEYSKMLGERHPGIFGGSMESAWGAVWSGSVQPIIQRVMKEKRSFSRKDHLVWLQRLNKFEAIEDIQVEANPMEAGMFIEETYHTFSYSPLLSNNGRDAIGFFALDAEVTDSVVAQRRLATARELSLTIAPALTSKAYYKGIAESLETNPIDIPFILVYSCTMARTGQAFTASGTGSERRTITGNTATITHTASDTYSDSASMNSGSMLLRLQASCGLKDAFQDEFKSFILDFEKNDQANDLPFPFQDAVRDASNLIHVYLDPATAAKFVPRSWDEASHQAVVCPIVGDQRTVPEAILVIGLNSRRPWKKTYVRFVEEMVRSMSAGLSTVKALEKERKHLANLKRLDQAKTAFFSNVSHELRSPLQLIAGPAADALQDPDLSKKDRSRYSLISRATSRLLRLVNSLLDFAGLEAGRHAVTVQPVKLSAYTADLASLFRSAIERAGLTYNVVCEGDDIGYTDTAAYEKIVYNLISNALKYTVRGSIDVHFFKNDKSFVLQVRDTGIGIPEAELARVFQRFHRVENNRARSIEGTGIGLALTREFSRLIKGELSVESVEAQNDVPGGSTFSLVLPLGYDKFPEEIVRFDEVAVATEDLGQGYSKRAIADELAGAWESQSVGSVEDDGNHHDGDDLASEREAAILVVDDNNDVRGYIVSILSAICRTVTAVVDGQDAIDILKTNVRIDLVVSDVMMPRVDGFQLLESIRQDPARSQVPVILLSARAGPEATAEGLSTGATDYLPKPFASKELIARVRNALSNSKNAQRLETLVAERTAELAALERRATHLMGILPAGVFESTSDGLVTWANESWHRMSGWPCERMPFKFDEWMERVCEEDRPKLEAAAGRILAYAADPLASDQDPSPIIADWRWNNPPEVPQTWCIAQLHPTDDGFIGVLTDYTASKRLTEQSLAHERQRTEDALSLARSQESFLDVVSHELRNPLSAIINGAELCNGNLDAASGLLDGTTDLAQDQGALSMLEEAKTELEEASESTQGIIASARHMSLIASDILSVSRFNRGLMNIVPIDICLVTELHTIGSMFEGQTRSNGIQLELALGTEVTPTLCVSADPTRLNQILVNLISNSLRILESYDGERRCTIEAHALPAAPEFAAFHRLGTDLALQDLGKQGGLQPNCPVGTEVWLLFLVRDTGPGISMKTQAQLFTKFNSIGDGKATAMDGTRSAVGGGAGLGLYLAKKLAELMGGKIDVVSEEGKYCDFVFYIRSEVGRQLQPKKPSKGRLRAPRLAARTLGSSPASTRSSFSTTASPESKSINLAESPSANGGPAQMPESPKTATNRSSTPVENTQRGHLNVMVAEDNLLNQKLLSRQLVKSGIATRVANNGQEAIDRLLGAAKEGNRVNALLLDLEMPVLGGIEAAIRIRELEKQGTLPGRLYIFAVTGNAREHFLTESMKAGMDDVLTKPYRFPDILAKLDALEL